MTRTRLLAVAGLVAIVIAVPSGLPWWRERAVRSVRRPLDTLLITLDTTRADRLGSYGGSVDTPHLDGIARRGVRFTQAYAHVPLTCPSHASMMTGLIPPRHGVHDNGGFVLGDGIPTLAERFVEAGYRTGAFVSAFVLDRRFGLARGFASYEDDVLGGGRDNFEASVRGEVTAGRAAEWIRKADDRPLFAWVHLYDPHTPYDPPEPFKSRYAGRPYEGEVAYMDAQVGVVLQALGERGRPALVVAVADHGESLGEHGEASHSYFIYGSTQRVPFLVSLPEGLPGGRTVDALVRLVDVAPTILDVAGLSAPDGIDGRSLLRLMVGREADEPGPAYQESYHPRIWWGAEPLLGLRSGPWFYVKAPTPELYRVDRDPGETRNLAATETLQMSRMAARLEAMAGSHDPLAARTELDPGTEERLRALGYAGPAPAPRSDRPLADAKTNRALLAGVARASELSNVGKKDEALAVMRETLKVNPRSEAVRAWTAWLLLELGRHEEAFQGFAELALEDPRNESYPLRTAQALIGQKRVDDALAELQSAVVRFPTSPRLHEELGAVLDHRGDLEAARVALERAVSLAPRQVPPHLRLAVVLGKMRRLRESGAELRTVIELSPRSGEAGQAGELLALLAPSLTAQGDLGEAGLAYVAAAQVGSRREDVYLNGGLVLYRLGRRAEALGLLKQGVERLPESAALRYREGRLLEEAGRVAEAQGAYAEAARLAPDRPDARAALDRLKGRP